VSAASSLTVTSGCLTVGSGAQLAVVLKLVDSSGAPATGASVTFNSTSAVSWLEPAVVEVANPPGTYYRTLLAPAAAGGTTISASVSYCGATTPITATRDIHFAGAAPATGYAGAAFQGIGGCAPVGGHIRVKVIAAESGMPIAGASVLVGASGGTPFVPTAAALFPTPAASGANTATTNAQGIAELVDFGSSLQGAPIVTAGAPNRAYQTYYHFSGADQVLALPLRRPTTTTYRYTGGTGAPIPSRPDCTWVQAGFALQDTTLDQLGVFNLSSLVGPNKCVNTGAITGMKSIPENIFAPQQQISTSALLCFAASINTTSSFSVNAGMRELGMPFVRIPVSVLQGGGALTDLIQGAVFQSIGYQPQSPTGPVSNDNLTLNDTYPVNATFTFGNTPDKTDVTGVVLVDYSGGDGWGALGINGIQVHKYTDTGSTVVVPVGTVQGAPAGTRYLGAAVASFLPPTDSRMLPADIVGALTSTVVRDGPGGSQPFGSGASSALGVTNFLGLAPGAVANGGTLFTFGDATKAGQTPQYSISTLSVSHSTWLPQLGCETAPSKTTQSYPQWVVVRPHADDAAACTGLTSATSNCEAFTLPTLPASFPVVTAGTQQQSGFEQFVGSGAACSTSAPCKLASEKCQVPVNTTQAAQCMGFDNTNYFTEQYLWTLEDRALGNAPTAVTAGAADLTQWRPGLTQESANKINW
jgi:hypothetical protein